MSEHHYQGSWQAFSVSVEHGVMVPMRDGLGLATDIYFPTVDGHPVPGPFPVLVERTPYDKDATRFVLHARFFARHGYVVLMQDVRGRGNSEGDWYPFAREAADGYDTIEWAAAQPWCDGKVGTMGTSYMAAVQSAAATLNPPHLKAMFVTEGPSDYYSCSMRQNGALEQRFLIYAFHMAVTSKEARANPALRVALLEARNNLAAWLGKLPLKKGASPLRLLPNYEQWALDLQSHGDYDEYWRQRGYAIHEYYAEHADVPTVYFGSWYDSYARATTENFVALSKLRKSPQRLVMGPWTHGVTMDQEFSGDVTFGPDAIDHYNGLRLRWFDYWLKGLDTGVINEPPVQIFVMGGGSGKKTYDVLGLAGRLHHGGRWRGEQEWPLARANKTPYYLHADGTLAPEKPRARESSTTYRFDPRDPVPTLGGCISVGFEFMLLDRPVIVIDCPELIEKAHVGSDKVSRLRSAAEVVQNADEVAAAVVRALKHPARLSSRRRTIADELFYGAGSATARAVQCIYDLLALPAPEAEPAAARPPSIEITSHVSTYGACSQL